MALADQLASRLDDGTALILDLDPVVGVHVAARLNAIRLANAVIVVPRWAYQAAILPVDQLIGAIIQTSESLTSASESLTNVVFVLDAERTKRLQSRSTRDPRADNRYELLLADLPNLATLRSAGVRKLMKISRG